MKECTTIQDILKIRAVETPNKMVFTQLKYSGNERIENQLTYKQLYQQAKKMAAYFQKTGMSSKTAVLLYPTGLEFMTCLFGCFYAGVYAVPLNSVISKNKIERLLSVIEDSHSNYILTDSSTAEKVNEFIKENLADTEISVIVTDTIEGISENDFKEVEYGGDELAYLQYTSGSTSAPKGVMITHKNIMHNLKIQRELFGVDNNSIGLLWVPHDHDMGIFIGRLIAVYSGYGQYFMDPFDFISKPLRFLQALSDFKVTITGMPNFGFEHCVSMIKDADLAKLDLSSVNIAINGAEPIHEKTLIKFNEKFGKCGWKQDIIAPGYGLAETTLVAVINGSYEGWDRLIAVPFKKEALERNKVQEAGEADEKVSCVSSGPLKEDVDIRIVNPETFQECSDDSIGEIWIASESNSPGYWEKEEINKQVFRAKLQGSDKNYLRTGDLGFIFKKNLFITGRIKDLIIIRGVNYYPGDIEYTVGRANPNLVAGNSAVFANITEDEEGIYALTEVKEDNQEDYEAIIEDIRREVIKHHGVDVKGIVLLRENTLPKTPSGKIQRLSCKNMYFANKFQVLYQDIHGDDLEKKDSHENGRSRTEKIENKVMEYICECLRIKRDSLDRNKNLVALGMDSLHLSIFKQDLEDEYGVFIEMSFLFDCTIGELIEFIDSNYSEDKKEERQEEKEKQSQLVTSQGDKYEAFPLTELQNAYWMGRNKSFELGGVSAHGFFSIDLAEKYSYEKMDAALGKLIVRHEMLRAVLTEDGKQRILENPGEYHITYHDLRKEEDTEKELKCNEIKDSLANEVIDLETWPLFHVHYIDLGVRKKLYFSIDLMIADIWSINILFKEWFSLYNNLDEKLADIGVQFKEYCTWFYENENTKKYQKAKKYWEERIPFMPQSPKLPLQVELKQVKDSKFSHRSFVLDKELWLKFRNAAMKNSVTPTAAILTAYAQILKYWSQSKDFTLNLTVFNRSAIHPDINQVIGDFTSVLPLEIQDQKDSTFSQKARCIQKQLASDLQNKDYSGISVLRELGNEWGKKPNEVLLPVVFTSALSSDMEMVFQSEEHFFGKSETFSQTPQVYLDHQVYESNGTLVFNWDTIDAVFPENMIHDMFETYQNYVKKLAVDEEVWSVNLEPELPKEQKQRRMEYNQTQGPVSEDVLYTKFIENTRSCKEQIAIYTVEKEVTYDQLYRSAAYIASSLQKMGVKPNDIVGVSINKGWQQIVAVLGIVMSGAAYVCIDPVYPAKRKNYIIEHSGAKAVLVYDESAAKELDSEVFYVKDDILEEEEQEFEIVNEPDNLAYILYTSGSTGNPKGVAITHRGALNTILDINERFDVTKDDKAFAISSLSFDLSVYDIFGMLCAGGTIVMPEPFNEKNPDHWIMMAEKYKVTVWNSVPSLCEMLIESLEALGKKLSLRLIMMSGDWIPVTLPERIRNIDKNARIISLGGATEASIWSIFYPIEEVKESWNSIPYGRPLTNQTFYVMNEDKKDCPEWVAGDLYIGGTGVALGYYKEKEKTEKAFVKHPITGEKIYKTGDLGRFLPDGNIEFLGRQDFQVKIGGFRIELGEIESVITSHKKVQRCIVKKVVNDTGNMALAAYVVENTLEKIEQETKGEYDFASEIIGDSDDLLLDSHKRLMFKLGNPSLRFKEDEKLDTTVIPLCSEVDESRYMGRISTRNFLQEPVEFQRFSDFLSCLRKIDIDGMKRFAYASAGAVYPVQAYVYVKKGRVEGVEEGLYYYHPFNNSLIYISKGEKLTEDIHVEANKKIYTSSAFSIFFVGKLSAIEPLYGEKARDFCLIEAGIMSQLLETTGADLNIGTCQVGALSEPGKVMDAVQADEKHILLHVMLAGKADKTDLLRGILVDESKSKDKKQNNFKEELKDFCREKLPHYMIPAHIIILDKIPLTPIGKVDYKSLPQPKMESEKNLESEISFANDMEKFLYEIFKEKSGISGINTTTSFFDLGINSLTITKSWREIMKKTGLNFAVIRIFEKPTIQALAKYLLELKDQESQSKNTEQLVKKEETRNRAATQKAALRKNLSRRKK